MVKKIKQRKGKDNSVRRHTGVIIEHIDHKFNLLADQYLDINKKLDQHTIKLDSHTEMIGAIATDVEIIKADIEFLKHSVRKKVDVEEFSALERRVTLLEKKTHKGA